MRGNNLIWIAFAALLLASLGNGIPVAHADGSFRVYVDPPTTGPLPPSTPGHPSTFGVDIKVENAYSVHAYQIKLTWNQKILRVNETALEAEKEKENNATTSERFLAIIPGISQKRLTYMAFAVGVAGESVTVADLIRTYDTADGNGTLVHIEFEVIGGGKTDLALKDATWPPWGVTQSPGEVRFEDADGFPIDPDSIENGMFWSDYPYIDFTWYVATALNSSTPPNHVDGVRAHQQWVLGGTMYYGDEIKFDSSGSYDLDNTGHLVPLNQSAFNWVIRAGGMDLYVRKSATGKFVGIYDFRYASGATPGGPYTGTMVVDGKARNYTYYTGELSFGSVIYYTFPGKLPSTYSLYGSSHLGWHDLNVSVIDSDGHVATYYNWIRIFRLSPARTVMETKTTSSYHLSEQGVTYGYKMYFYGKVQNRGGTGTFPEATLATYLELGRMIKGSFWAGMKFTIKSLSGKPTKILVTPAAMMYNETVGELAPTETPIYPQGPAVWEGIGAGDVGFWISSATGMICGSGATYGLPATGTIVKSFVIKP